MHLRARRILSALFFLVFITATPAIIVSTAGYRYNFIKGRLERTGVMFISTKPSNARIFLNEKEEKSETPARVRQLLPGKYDVRIEKEGYHPWSRTVEVRSRETSFLNNLILFKRGIPELELELSVDEMSISDDGHYVALISKQESIMEVRLVDLKTYKTWLPYRAENANGGELTLSWSKDSERLLISRKKLGRSKFFIWDKSNPVQLKDLRSVSPLPYEQAFWSEEGRYVYAATDRRLFLLDIRELTARDTGPSVQNMTVLKSGVFGIFKDTVKSAGDVGNGNTALVRRQLDSEEFVVLGPLPQGNYRYLNGSKYIVLLDEVRGKLIVVDPTSEPNELNYFEANADHAEWSKEGNQLIYWNDLELHTYDPASNVARLVTRLGTRLVDAAWYSRNGIIFFSDQSTVRAIDGDDLLSRNITEVARFSSVREFSVNPSMTRAWFVGSIGDKAGLWTMRIR